MFRTGRAEPLVLYAAFEIGDIQTACVPLVCDLRARVIDKLQHLLFQVPIATLYLLPLKVCPLNSSPLFPGLDPSQITLQRICTFPPPFSSHLGGEGFSVRKKTGTASEGTCRIRLTGSAPGSPAPNRAESLHRSMGPGVYVPISQDDRYFFCSLVSLSMATPLVSSLSRATCLSISMGTP